MSSLFANSQYFRFTNLDRLKTVSRYVSISAWYYYYINRRSLQHSNNLLCCILCYQTHGFILFILDIKILIATVDVWLIFRDKCPFLSFFHLPILQVIVLFIVIISYLPATLFWASLSFDDLTKSSKLFENKKQCGLIFGKTLKLSFLYLWNCLFVILYFQQILRQSFALVAQITPWQVCRFYFWQSIIV